MLSLSESFRRSSDVCWQVLFLAPLCPFALLGEFLVEAAVLVRHSVALRLQFLKLRFAIVDILARFLVVQLVVLLDLVELVRHDDELSTGATQHLLQLLGFRCARLLEGL